MVHRFIINAPSSQVSSTRALPSSGAKETSPFSASLSQIVVAFFPKCCVSCLAYRAGRSVATVAMECSSLVTPKVIQHKVRLTLLIRVGLTHWSAVDVWRSMACARRLRIGSGARRLALDGWRSALALDAGARCAIASKALCRPFGVVRLRRRAKIRQKSRLYVVRLPRRDDIADVQLKSGTSPTPNLSNTPHQTPATPHTKPHHQTTATPRTKPHHGLV
ncbi:hypothetical protein CEPID_04595 [Corynebacterium epidermidicanis]|uniref:Uncharacterized protein n=1 Tax=Corynebacterium epidermidicanis TaxID=1050174 RepID=A0A0G3GNR5_9CORY|nr:hypothetical protein CEPID_04595 [Corynebacterium epidermidicanis]